MNYNTFDTHAHLEPLCRYKLSWFKLSYSVRSIQNYVKILHELSGHVEPGQMLAVMGPSGGGKTTLLNLLADRVSSGVMEGDILVNGFPRSKLSPRTISYVAQNDCFLEVFTVLETIEFVANLTIADSFERDKRVMSVIHQMGLQSCKDLRIGGTLFKGISGGQRRRLSIAMSLITNPCIILMDEPTTGLDSYSSLAVIKHVKSLAAQGRTVVLSVHQPASELYQLFDMLLIVSKGKTMYMGPAVESIKFFAQAGYPCPKYSNPGEYFMTFLNTDFSTNTITDLDKINQIYSKSRHSEEMLREIDEVRQNPRGCGSSSVVYKSNWFIQFYYLTKRNLANSALNPGIFWFRVFIYLYFSLMVGTMYYRENEKIDDIMLTNIVCFFLAYTIFMSVCMLPFFMMQKPVFVMERSSGMIDVFPFVVSNFLSCIPAVALISISSAVTTFYLIDLAGDFWYFSLALFLALVCAEGLMHVLSTTTPIYIIALSEAAAIYGMFLLCEGFYLPKRLLPEYLDGFYYGAFHTYAYKVLVFNQFNETNRFILKQRELENVDMDENLIILGCYAVVLQIIFFFLVYFLQTGKK